MENDRWKPIGEVAQNVVKMMTTQPLVFEDDPLTEIQVAKPMRGIIYNIKKSHEPGWWAWRCLTDGDFYFDVADEQAAKTACQDDWNKRIGEAVC